MFASPLHSQNDERCCRAFTLTELLTGVVAIAVLLAILVSVVADLRRRSRGAQCVSHLRQIGLANLMYMQEVRRVMAGDGVNGETGKNYERWRRTIRDYLVADRPAPARYQVKLPVMICPADPSKGADPAAATTAPLDTLSYAANYVVSERNSAGRRMDDPRIQPHSSVVYAGDTIVYNPGLTNWISGHSESALALRLPKDWHDGYINFVFLDGHVAAYRREALFPGKSDNHILREQ